MEITTGSNLYNDNFIKCEPYIELTNGSSITINSDGINLIGATPTPYTPYPIKFPTIGEWDLYKHHEGCDFGCDAIDALRYGIWQLKDDENNNKKEGKEMKLLNMYVEKSQENIRNYYQNLIEMEKNNDVVTKEYDELINKFVEDMEKLAEKYNESNTPNGSYLTEDCGDYDFHYMVVHENTEKEQMYYKLRDEEMGQLREKIEEVQAQLEIITNDENSSYHDINYVLHNYGIIDDNYKLTPYAPTFVNGEAPKKVGRPKKVSE